MKFIFIILVFATVLLAGPGFAAACPYCYSGTNSPETAGMNWAILAMLGITGTVLAIILGVTFFFWRRAKRQHAQISDILFVNEDGQFFISNVKRIPEWNNF